MKIVMNGAKKAYMENNYTSCVVTKFLIFPLCVNGELRWLERATWIRRPDYKYTFLFEHKKYYWENIEWVEEKNESKNV